MIWQIEDKLVRWTPRIVLGLGVIVVLLAGVAVYTLTQYQPKTACADNPAGHECQQIRVDGKKAQSKRVACIDFRQVGYACPAPQSKVRQELSQNGSTKESSDDPNNGTPPSQEPAPGSPPSDAPDPPVSGPSSSGGDGGGSSQGGGSDTPPTSPPQTPPTEPPVSPGVPPQSQTPGLLDPVTDPICQTTTQLGVPVCL